MKTTLWFIEYWTEQHGWLPSCYRPPEDCVSEAAVNYWYQNVLAEVHRREPYRAVSCEIEVSAKDVVKVRNREVELNILGDYWRRTEFSSSRIEWRKFNRDAGLPSDGWGILYLLTRKQDNWQTVDSEKCEEPEIERIWREYCNG